MLTPPTLGKSQPIKLLGSRVLPADAEKFSIYKEIESEVSLPVPYRTRQCDTITVPRATTFAWRLGVKNTPEKPRWIVIGFQTLKNMYVMLNSSRYPAVDYNLSFANQQFSRAYGDASLFGIRYFGMDELITRSNISPADYKTLYPSSYLM